MPDENVYDSPIVGANLISKGLSIAVFFLGISLGLLSPPAGAQSRRADSRLIGGAR
jgi:hypothetical protein